jgi:hypothetical protein
MAPPIEGGDARSAAGRSTGGGGGSIQHHNGRRIRIPTGAPIGAQACSPRKPFMKPSPFNPNTPVPVPGGGGLSDMSTVAAKVAFSARTGDWLDVRVALALTAPPAPR